MKIQRQGVTIIELLVVVSILLLLASMLLPATALAREAARRLQCQNNLRQLALANHNYEAAMGHFPPGTVDEHVINWGWSAVLLPYLEGQPIPADALRERCTTVIAEQPEIERLSQQVLTVFNCPSDPQPNPLDGILHSYPEGTYDLPLFNYLGISGISSYWIPGQFDTGGMFFTKSKVRVSQVTDGTHRTFMIGERRVQYEITNTEPPIIFTPSHCYCGPQTSFQFNPIGVSLNRKVGRGFSSRHPGGVHFAYVDGHVELLADETDVAILQAAAMRSDEK